MAVSGLGFSFISHMEIEISGEKGKYLLPPPTLCIMYIKKLFRRAKMC